MTPRSILALASAIVVSAGCRPAAREAASPAPMTVTPTAAPTPRPLPDPLPEVLGRVNDRPVPLRSARIIVQQSLAGRTPTDEERSNAYRLALEQLITRELLFQEAVRRKIEPDAGAIDRLRQQVRSEYKGEKAWKAFLETQGLDAKTFDEELRVRSMVERLLQQETAKVPGEISEKEARAYYGANPNIFESAGRPLPFEDVRERITGQLVTFKRSEALNTLLTQLRAASRVEIFI
jgi:hypothetical protein